MVYLKIKSKYKTQDEKENNTLHNIGCLQLN